MQKPEVDTPTVSCVPTRTRDGTWWLEFHCPHCRARHMHGGGTGAEPIAGHRVAHCRDERSPWFWSGYVLVAQTVARACG
jgi:hypothetical protein